MKYFGLKSSRRARRWQLPHWRRAAPSAARPRPDYVLYSLIAILTVFGSIMLLSASGVESFRQYQDAYYLFRHQLFYGLLPGLVAFFFLLRYDYRKLEQFAPYFLGAALLLMVLVFVPGIGVTLKGARSWIGIAGITFQPTELVKLLVILFLAAWFGQRGREMTHDFWNGLLPFALILGLCSLLIVLQPDVGTLLIVAMIAWVMYFVAGADAKHLVGLLVAGGGAVALLIAQAPYRAARLVTFFNPETDQEGIGYHINQAFLAIGSGGWFGVGFGQSRQKFAYLPEVIGDVLGFQQKELADRGITVEGELPAGWPRGNS